MCVSDSPTQLEALVRHVDGLIVLPFPEGEIREVRCRHCQAVDVTEFSEQAPAFLEQRSRASAFATVGSDGAEVVQASGDARAIAEISIQRKARLDVPRRLGVVGLESRENSGATQQLRAGSRRSLWAQRRGSPEPGAAFRHLAAHVPKLAKGSRQPQRRIRVARERPLESRAEVVLLRLKPLEPAALTRWLVIDLLGELEEVVGMPAAREVLILVFGESLCRELADCLEHAEALACVAEEALP